MSFVSDNKKGMSAELHVKKFFERMDTQCVLGEKNKTIEYDMTVKIGRKKYKCEVKYDIMAEKTGNLAIEFYNPKLGKNSGIASTESHIWIVVVNDKGNKTIWAINTDKLKAFIKANSPKRIVSVGGDDNASLYLYDDYFILEEFVRLDDTLDVKEFKKRLKEIVK